jgi:hypothetical protein
MSTLADRWKILTQGKQRDVIPSVQVKLYLRFLRVFSALIRPVFAYAIGAAELRYGRVVWWRRRACSVSMGAYERHSRLVRYYYVPFGIFLKTETLVYYLLRFSCGLLCRFVAVDVTCQQYTATDGNCSAVSTCMNCGGGGCYAVEEYPKIGVTEYGRVIGDEVRKKTD